MANKRILITGGAGQDGTLLTRLLREQGHDVWVVVRPGSKPMHDVGADRVISMDLAAATDVESIIDRVRPDECYHLAACHRSSDFREDAAVLHATMTQVNFRVTELLASAILARSPHCRFVFAGSSQMYTPRPGPALTSVSEETPFSPATYYGLTKTWSRELISYLRHHHQLVGGTAILFNHESVLRTPQFVTRKITLGAARAQRDAAQRISLQSVSRRVDWSSAGDVVQALALMGASPEPDDYVIASGQAHAVSDVLEIAYGRVGLAWQDHVDVSDRADDPGPALVGISSKIRSRLGWLPRQSFRELIVEMTDHDVLETSGKPTPA